MVASTTALALSTLVLCPSMAAASVPPSTTVSLMVEGMLGEFEDEGYEGYACTFEEWTNCVNGTDATDCNDAASSCSSCTSKRSGNSEPITCTVNSEGQTEYRFPPGGIFPVTEQFHVPPNTAIVGAANPTDPTDQAIQQTDVGGQTWFVVPKSKSICGDDPWCSDSTASAPTACSGDPRTHRQGFLMSTNSSLININHQGADIGRAGSEGTLCGPGAIELPGCLSGDECKSWVGGEANGDGVVDNVLIRNVRLSDAVKRADVAQMKGDCAEGEALDGDGQHVRAHQVSVWVSKLPNSADANGEAHTNVVVDNLVSMNSRADGLNVHGSVDGFTLKNGYLAQAGDDCIGVWGAGVRNMLIQNMTTENCAVTAGAQGNWGSCMGTYAFMSVAVDGLKCIDPFETADGCNPRTHYTAIHLNHAFADDCQPVGATLSLSDISYSVDRPACGQCRSCCGQPTCLAGFENMTIVYDGTVPDGECMAENAGC